MRAERGNRDTAEEEGRPNVARLFRAISFAERGHVQICGVCGYTTEGDAPDSCPVCGAPKGKFRSFV